MTEHLDDVNNNTTENASDVDYYRMLKVSPLQPLPNLHKLSLF